MTPNQLIEKAALANLEGKYGPNPAIDYCQNFARTAIEGAFGLSSGAFYRWVSGVGGNPTAAQVETLIRHHHADCIVPFSAAQPGDVVYWQSCYRGDKFGHVAILTDRNKNGKLEAAQNTTLTSGIVQQYKGAIRLLDFSVECVHIGRPSTVVRMPKLA